MQFFWKHLHNNKGDENVSKLIWIVIAFVVGALLLSTMSVAFRTNGTIGGWLDNTMESWFGEADGRDSSTSGGSVPGGVPGGTPGGSPGGGNEASSLYGIVVNYDASIQALTTNNDKDGKNYSSKFDESKAGEFVITSYMSTTGTSKGNQLFTGNATVITKSELATTDSNLANKFADNTFILYEPTSGAYIGVDVSGNIIIPFDSDPASGAYMIFDVENTGAENNAPIVLTWNTTNSTLTSSGKDYSAMFSPDALTEGLSYAVSAYPSASNGSNVDETDSVLGEEYAVAQPAVSPYKTGTMMLKANNGVTTGVDTSGNILVMNATRPSTGNAVYSQGTEGFEGAGPEDGDSNVLVHNGTIPEGGTYYVGISSNQFNPNGYTSYYEKYEAGDKFPDTIRGLDVYVYGDYEYRYEREYCYSNNWNGGGTGWAARVLDSSKKEYGEILKSINNENVNSLECTFFDCANLTTAPVIPDSITDMAGTFKGCINLTTTSAIPDGVTNMNGTFNGCLNLTEAPVIPNSVNDMTGTFGGCTSLTVAPVIPYGVNSMNGTFNGCSSLTEAPVIPNSVKDMSYAFYYCTSLTKASTISNSTTNMTYTFADCTSLTKAPEIPNTVTSMYATFLNCNNLTVAPVIPNGVTDIGMIFQNCTKLKTYLGSTDADGDFSNYVIPNSVTNMFQSFTDCVGLIVAPIVPDNVTAATNAFLRSAVTGDVIINAKNITSANGILSQIYQSITVYVPANSVTLTTITNTCSGPGLSYITIKTF